MKLLDYLETIADDLRDPEYALELLQLGWADAIPTFLVALRDTVTVNLGMAKLAEITGMSRESLYKTLLPSGNPRLATIRKILQALNYDFKPENNFAVGQAEEDHDAASETAFATV